MYKGGDIFYIFGEPYELRKSIGKKKLDIVGKVIYLSYKDDSDEYVNFIYKQLDKKLLALGEDFRDRYLHILSAYGYEKVPDMGCRIMKSKWGVCYIRKNKINLSSYLIHYPLDCLEYVVIHELVHFIVPNHSKRFYEIVSSNMPNYKEVKKKMKM